MAALVVTKIVADYGLPLEMAKAIGESAAPHVAFFVSLRLREAEATYFQETFALQGGHRFVIFGENGLPSFRSDLLGAFEGEQMIGIVLDLEAVGAELFRVLPKPIVKEVADV